MKLYEKQMRQVYGETLVELGKENKNIVVLEADLMRSSGTSIFKENFPDRLIDVGVAEANMIGIAAGLSTLGKIPFCNTFTCFASRRVYDQITISVAYANRNVKIVGTSPGITAGPNGGTHMCFQDLAIMRVMPNMVVISPSDAYELREVIKWTVNYEGPVYMQLIRSKRPPIFDSNYKFTFNKAVILTEGKDITIVSTGYTTYLVKEAVEILSNKGIMVEHLHYPVIKPFDTKTLISSASKTGFVITVENQNIIGGLGGAVCETLSENYPVKVKRLGVPDKFGEVGTEDYLLKKHHFSINDIVKTVEEEIRKERR